MGSFYYLPYHHTLAKQEQGSIITIIFKEEINCKANSDS